MVVSLSLMYENWDLGQVSSSDLPGIYRNTAEILQDKDTKDNPCITFF